MKNKIFNLLKTFSEAEIKSFREFICSPYFNHSKKVILLYNEILRYYPEFKNKNLDKMILYNKIIGPGRYNDSTLRHLFFHLLNLAQLFLSFEATKDRKGTYYNNLLMELLRRDQKELFLKNMKRAEHDLLTEIKIDEILLYDLFQLQSNQFNYKLLHDKVLNVNKTLPRIQLLSDTQVYLTIYYIINLVNAFINLYTETEKFNINRDSYVLTDIIRNINFDNLTKTVKDKNKYGYLLQVYFALFNTYNDFENDKFYFLYKKVLNKHANKFSKDEISLHYSNRIAYCILKVNKGQNALKYQKELFNNYVFFLKNELYKDTKFDFMQESLFRAILFCSLNLKRFKWAYDFIIEYSKKVQPMHSNNMYNYGMAHYNYYKGLYNQSLDASNKISLDYFIFKYDIKNLLLKIYTEMGYYEEAIYLINSYREMLRKDKFLTTERKQLFHDFIMFTEKLIFILNGNSKTNINILKRKITRSKCLYNDWLLSKLV